MRAQKLRERNVGSDTLMSAAIRVDRRLARLVEGKPDDNRNDYRDNRTGRQLPGRISA